MPKPPRRGNLLVVDDEVELMRALCETLRDEGMKVVLQERFSIKDLREWVKHERGGFLRRKVRKSNCRIVWKLSNRYCSISYPSINATTPCIT